MTPSEKAQKQIEKLREQFTNNLAEISRLEEINNTIAELRESYEKQKELYEALEKK